MILVSFITICRCDLLFVDFRMYPHIQLIVILDFRTILKIRIIFMRFLCGSSMAWSLPSMDTLIDWNLRLCCFSLYSAIILSFSICFIHCRKYDKLVYSILWFSFHLQIQILHKSQLILFEASFICFQ